MISAAITTVAEVASRACRIDITQASPRLISLASVTREFSLADYDDVSDHDLE